MNFQDKMEIIEETAPNLFNSIVIYWELEDRARREIKKKLGLLYWITPTKKLIQKRANELMREHARLESKYQLSRQRLIESYLKISKELRGKR